MARFVEATRHEFYAIVNAKWTRRWPKWALLNRIPLSLRAQYKWFTVGGLTGGFGELVVNSASKAVTSYEDEDEDEDVGDSTSDSFWLLVIEEEEEEEEEDEDGL